jgi:hypothetical protein
MGMAEPAQRIVLIRGGRIKLAQVILLHLDRAAECVACTLLVMSVGICDGQRPAIVLSGRENALSR